MRFDALLVHTAISDGQKASEICRFTNCISVELTKDHLP